MLKKLLFISYLYTFFMDNLLTDTNKYIIKYVSRKKEENISY